MQAMQAVVGRVPSDIAAVARASLDSTQSIRDAKRDVLQHRLWIQQNAQTARQSELDVACAALDRARARLLEPARGARARRRRTGPGHRGQRRSRPPRAGHPAPRPRRAMTPLVLASTSRYRRELLARLGLPFEVDRPGRGRNAAAGRSARRHRRAAWPRPRPGVVAARHPGAWVIGSDQVADLDGLPLGKAGGREPALAQLRALFGPARRCSIPRSACCATASRAAGAATAPRCVFRTLARDEIERYLDAEQPYDCAGSFKCEGLGITLFDAIDSRDPTALVGLPLIAPVRRAARGRLRAALSAIAMRCSGHVLARCRRAPCRRRPSQASPPRWPRHVDARGSPRRSCGSGAMRQYSTTSGTALAVAGGAHRRGHRAVTCTRCDADAFLERPAGDLDTGRPRPRPTAGDVQAGHRRRRARPAAGVGKPEQQEALAAVVDVEHLRRRQRAGCSHRSR